MHHLRRLLSAVPRSLSSHQHLFPKSRSIHSTRRLFQQQQSSSSSSSSASSNSNLGVIAALGLVAGGYLYFENLHQKDSHSKSHSHSSDSHDDTKHNEKSDKKDLKFEKLPKETFVVFVLGGESVFNLVKLKLLATFMKPFPKIMLIFSNSMNVCCFV
jgi:hypothetical protein